MPERIKPALRDWKICPRGGSNPGRQAGVLLRAPDHSVRPPFANFADKEREGWMVVRHERAACLKPAPVANMGESIEREIACLELA